MQEFFRQFEDYCKTPGVDSGKARSYAKAIEYLCDYLKITAIDVQSVSSIKELEKETRTIILYEAPHRLVRTLQELLEEQ